MEAPPAMQDSLPYIETEPSPSARASAQALLAAEEKTQPAPALFPPAYRVKLTKALTAEVERIASKQSSVPLPLSRYEAQEPPASDAVRPALEAAYVSAAYLAARARNLDLLDSYGPNAWLLHNYHLDSLRQRLDSQRAAVAADIDVVNARRQALQMDAKPELDALEAEWKRTLAQVLETELDVCRLEAQIRRQRRALVAQHSDTPT
ncbi:hypothetical protein XA68_11029 [Ophiocordyceps unilateralis]|uniref:Pre-mRNA-splicing factor SPF27 n=1 Tax=Ophiocordyceps unilateralis TaxID=268505 RepID=A0A2A9PHP9_OPHUN|nr:hypothetical protein XA68_11029 [Ophiocordyceps unilateralis]